MQGKKTTDFPYPISIGQKRTDISSYKNIKH